MPAFDTESIDKNAKTKLEGFVDLVMEMGGTEKVKVFQAAISAPDADFKGVAQQVVTEAMGKKLINFEQGQDILADVKEAGRIQESAMAYYERTGIGTPPVSVNQMLSHAVDAGVEMHQNRENVRDLLIRSSKAVKSDEGKNVINSYVVETTHPEHLAMHLDMGGIVSTFQALNKAALAVENERKEKTALGEDPGKEFKEMTLVELRRRPELQDFKPTLGVYNDAIQAKDDNASLAMGFQNVLDHTNRGKPFSGDRASLNNFDFRQASVEFFGDIAAGYKAIEAMGVPDMPEVASVKYLNAQERQAYLITAQDGKLYRNGEVLDTMQTKSESKTEAHDAFVVDRTGNLYVEPHRNYQLHHSSFLSADMAQSAGMIQVQNGKVIHIDNMSGHYQPNEVEMVSVVKAIPQECFRQLSGQEKENLDTVDIGKVTIVSIDYTPDRTQSELATLFGKQPGTTTQWAVIAGEDGVKMHPVMNNKMFPAYDLVQEVETYQKEKQGKRETQWGDKYAQREETQAKKDVMDSIRAEYVAAHPELRQVNAEIASRRKIEEIPGIDDIVAGLGRAGASSSIHAEASSKNEKSFVERYDAERDNSQGKDKGRAPS